MECDLKTTVEELIYIWNKVLNYKEKEEQK